MTMAVWIKNGPNNMNDGNNTYDGNDGNDTREKIS
jgi:hypothetical protein